MKRFEKFIRLGLKILFKTQIQNQVTRPVLLSHLMLSLSFLFIFLFKLLNFTMDSPLTLTHFLQPVNVLNTVRMGTCEIKSFLEFL